MVDHIVCYLYLVAQILTKSNFNLNTEVKMYLKFLVALNYYYWVHIFGSTYTEQTCLIHVTDGKNLMLLNLNKFGKYFLILLKLSCWQGQEIYWHDFWEEGWNDSVVSIGFFCSIFVRFHTKEFILHWLSTKMKEQSAIFL